MEKIIVSDSKEHASYLQYLYRKISDQFSYLRPKCVCENAGERVVFSFDAERRYTPYIRKFAEEKIAEIIAIGYKYRHFKQTLRLPILTEEQRDVLFCALVTADFSEDYSFIRKKLKNLKEYCIDGSYHFRLGEIKARWQKIAEYIPTNFSVDSLENFVEFMVEEGENKVFLKEDTLYDEGYRPLQRSRLLGESSLKREILLSNANMIYVFGRIKNELGSFLKKYYKEKVVFC